MAVKKSGNTGKSTSKSNTKAAENNVTPINAGNLGNVLQKQIQPELVEAVRLRAYQIYEQRGREHGLDFEDWIRAEEEILSRYQKAKSA
jgi:hypothetical protein